jgi:hypothetical protein
MMGEDVFLSFSTSLSSPGSSFIQSVRSRLSAQRNRRCAVCPVDLKENTTMVPLQSPAQSSKRFW